MFLLWAFFLRSCVYEPFPTRTPVDRSTSPLGDFVLWRLFRCDTWVCCCPFNRF